MAQEVSITDFEKQVKRAKDVFAYVEGIGYLKVTKQSLLATVDNYPEDDYFFRPDENAVYIN